MSSDYPVAESPLWNESESAIYWREYSPKLGGCICRKSWPDSGDRVERFSLPTLGNIGGFVFVKNGGLLIFAQHGRVWYWREGRDPYKVAELPDADENTYFNDLIVDSAGRIYCGCLSHDFHNKANRGKHGSLWRFDNDGSYSLLETNTGACPNGMAFSPDLKYLYFAVTDDQTVYRYDYNNVSGMLDNRMTLIKQPGCDGMTVDAEGCLWVAHWGGKLVHYSSEGERLNAYSLPEKVRAISSVTFGGPDFKTIFVTTANYPDDNSAADYWNAGILSLHQHIRGMPEYFFDTTVEWSTLTWSTSADG